MRYLPKYGRLEFQRFQLILVAIALHELDDGVKRLDDVPLIFTTVADSVFEEG